MIKYSPSYNKIIQDEGWWHRGLNMTDEGKWRIGDYENQIGCPMFRRRRIFRSIHSSRLWLAHQSNGEKTLRHSSGVFLYYILSSSVKVYLQCFFFYFFYFKIFLPFLDHHYNFIFISDNFYISFTAFDFFFFFPRERWKCLNFDIVFIINRFQIWLTGWRV